MKIKQCFKHQTLREKKFHSVVSVTSSMQIDNVILRLVKDIGRQTGVKDLKDQRNYSK